MRGARPECARHREKRHGEDRQSTITSHYRTADPPGFLQSGAQYHHAGEGIIVEQLDEDRQSHHWHIPQASERGEKSREDINELMVTISRDNNIRF